MRAFDHLLVDVDDNGSQTSRQMRLRDSTCFWVSYGLCMIGIGAVSMWLFFKFIVMGS
jgi:hypothetical protein